MTEASILERGCALLILSELLSKKTTILLNSSCNMQLMNRYEVIVRFTLNTTESLEPTGWKNMTAMPWSCHDHTMIMAKHGHDHAMMTAWWPCFLAWSSWFIAWSWYDYHVFHDSYHDHGMFVMFSMFFLEKRMFCQCFLKKLLPYTILWHTWRALPDFTLPNWPISKIKRRILQYKLVFFSVINKHEVLIKELVQYNKHITAFCYFW